MAPKVRKAVIPAAGLGTRFLPATKALAKEMLPIVDKPTIQFIVEEALKSGIEEILVVTGKAKRSIEDHFDSNFELEYNLEQKGKTDLLLLISNILKSIMYLQALPCRVQKKGEHINDKLLYNYWKICYLSAV